MKELIVHIGLHKTGTTWIQRRLHELRDVLEKAAISYPDLDGRIAHHALAAEIRKGVDPSAPDSQQRSLLDRIRNTDFQRFVVSSEHFDEFAPDEVPHLKHFADAANVNLSVVYFIRNQVDLFESSLRGTRVYAKFLKTDDELLASCQERRAWKFATFHRMWESVLGKGNVRVGVYEDNDDILTGFALLSGLTSELPTAALVGQAHKRNPSMDARFVLSARKIAALADQLGLSEDDLCRTMLPLLRRGADRHLRHFGAVASMSVFSDAQRTRIASFFHQENALFSSEVHPLPEPYFNAAREVSQVQSIDVDYALQLAVLSLIEQDTRHTRQLRQIGRESAGLLQLGQELIKTGDFANAQSLSEHILRLNPKLPAAILLRVELFQRLGDIEAGVALLNEAITVDPDNPQLSKALVRLEKLLPGE